MECWWLWYGLAVPVVAVLVSGWWLAHAAQAITEADMGHPEPTWAPIRKWLFWASGLPSLSARHLSPHRLVHAESVMFRVYSISISFLTGSCGGSAW